MGLSSYSDFGSDTPVVFLELSTLKYFSKLIFAVIKNIKTTVRYVLMCTCISTEMHIFKSDRAPSLNVPLGILLLEPSLVLFLKIREFYSNSKHLLTISFTAVSHKFNKYKPNFTYYLN